MIHHALLKDQVKVSSAVTPTAGAAGTSPIEGTALDMQGFDGVLMAVRFGAITGNAVTSIKAQQSSTGSGDWEDLEGTGQTVADSDGGKIFLLDLFRPMKRYVRLYVSRATQNAVVASAEYHQYAARELPVTQPSGTLSEGHVSPDEGTA